ncbi:hypothetical protein ACGYLX_05490 [Sulfitobacter sp. 1A13496]|uniref:hypothetical protein n=1 Tax=Sulfitobacter sp. 1A13496 TaxID=3368596 RepID=UPI003744CC62
MFYRLLLVFALLLGLSACALPRNGPPPMGTEAEITELARAIENLSPQVNPEEAARAARIAYRHTHDLAIAYQITDPPLIHNVKVNNGSKPRGLCWHWAEDLEKRLKAEGFATLDLHRAIANGDSRILLDHSTAIISAAGAPMQAGLVLDPWRRGGELFWSPVTSDPRYDWAPREEVLRRNGRIRYVQAGMEG